MIIQDPKDVKPTKIITVTNTCKSPFEYMQQQRLASKMLNNDSNKKKDYDVKNLKNFNHEQQSNIFKNQFPK